VAGDELDDAIASYVKRRHNLIIGDRTAEEVKIAVGSALPIEEDLACSVRGRDMITGLPKTITITVTATKLVRSSRLRRRLTTLRGRNCATSKELILSSRFCLVICYSSRRPWRTRRTNTVRQYSDIGEPEQISRKRWESSSVLRPFTSTLHRSNALRLIAALATLGLIGGCHRESRIPSRPSTSVRLAPVTTVQTSAGGLRYSASIIPYAQVDLVFRTSGYVTGVKQVRSADGRIRDIGTGDYVQKGTVLAHVRLEDMKNEVAQAQAQLDQVMAQHAQADQDFVRAKALFSTQSLTKPDYDQSEQRFDSTRAAVDKAKAALRQAELTLGDSDLKAPFSGFLLNRYIDLGSLVSPSSAAFTIADISSVKATFGVPDYALNRLRLGQQLNISAEDDVTPVAGHVTSISPSADARNRVFAIEVTVANRGGRLKPGMIASLAPWQG